jgi:hypothetical protein
VHDLAAFVPDLPERYEIGTLNHGEVSERASLINICLWDIESRLRSQLEDIRHDYLRRRGEEWEHEWEE